ncbi:PSD1 and planctomycete cytochrome C domain-containing protein [Pirellulaceae bacterium SH449]
MMPILLGSRGTFAIFAALFLVGSDSSADDKGIEFFEARIRPLLIEHCVACHGDKKQWSGLRLDSRDGILAGGESGAAVIPGDPEASLLMRAVHRQDGLEMPPDYSLSELQIEDLHQWVRIGAPWPDYDSSGPSSLESKEAWKEHWAFKPLKTNFSEYFGLDREEEFPWKIDDFLHKKRAEQDLQLLDRADPRTLVRRLSFDVAGLPPDLEISNRFEQNATPEAYAALVDRLLESPHFGEQMARMWLDIARYSDTKGYVYGREERFQVHANTYRDWVIKAFNDDLPYDRFLRYQIAADRYATREPEHLAAMGFLTLGRRFLGVTHDIIDDRIDVVTRATLGLTVACARCHDHKYDPIPTADYYSLYGVFHNSTQRQVELIERSAAQAQQSAEWRAELDTRIKTLHTQMLASRKVASDRVRERTADYLYAQSELHKFPEEGFDQILSVSDLIPAFVRRWERYLATVRSDDGHPDQAILKPWFLFSSLASDTFAVQSEEVARHIQNDNGIHPWVAAKFESAPESLRDVADRYGQLVAVLVADLQRRIESGVQESYVDSLSLQTKPLLRFLYDSSSPYEIPDEEIVAIEGFFDSGTCTELWRLQGEVDRWRISANPNQRVAVGLFDREAIVLPRIFKRGVPANKGEVVNLRYLSMFSSGMNDEGPIPFRIGSGRWELADQITSPTNPLTARVWVNRLWQHFFGQGIVKSTSDFGLRSDAPSHPELLDWLARELMTSGWSTKAIVRKILLSNAYQASSGVGWSDQLLPAKMLETDPENRLVWRHSPRRLRWEEQCDSILKSSGKLDLELRFQQERQIAGAHGSTRRALYGFVDRQFLPSTLRVFDFANPDLSIGRRNETTIPQQSLYFLNSSFVANQVREIAKRCRPEGHNTNPQDSIIELFQALLQRSPTERELALGLEFLAYALEDESSVAAAPSCWSYGVGKIDISVPLFSGFQALPHFSGDAWQGGANWPDAAFGWAQLTAEGGHPGNDFSHAVVRRWTAPERMVISIESVAKHQPDVADGVRFSIFHNEKTLLASVQLKASERPMSIENIAVEAGDRIDFVVDINSELNTDQFLWAPILKRVATSDGEPKVDRDLETVTRIGAEQIWDAKADFRGPEEYKLDAWEQYVHVLLCTNEFLFVD